MNATQLLPAEAARAAADAVLAQKGRSFHWARRLLGPAHAARATRLYGFCRHLDDMADEAASPESARAHLARAREEIASGHSADAVIADGIRLMEECRIDRAIALELIAGLASDLSAVRIADEAALLRYCYRVAGTVGLMMCGALDVHHPAAFAHAVDLGIGMQLTNICRDVAEDAAADRRYLPASLVGDLAPAALARPAAALQPLLRESVATLLARAERYYRSGERGLPFLPLRARCGILVAGRVYRAIGARLRARGHASWEGRVAVGGWRKAALTAQALATAPWQERFWRSPREHDATLHLALRGLPCIIAGHAA